MHEDSIIFWKKVYLIFGEVFDASLMLKVKELNDGFMDNSNICFITHGDYSLLSLGYVTKINNNTFKFTDKFINCIDTV